MRYRKFGRSGIEVSDIAPGLWGMAGWSGSDDSCHLSPVFDLITISLHNGKTLKTVCENNSKDNKYIQSIRLNGKPLNQVWFRHADIINGGTLEL